MIFFAGPLLLIANVILVSRRILHPFIIRLLEAKLNRRFFISFQVNLSVRTMVLAIRVSRMKMRAQATSTETNAQTNGHDKTD
mmetsp:Transcript_21696/g.88486  ORF Transcript_21696/g.88486 Transcript_21696/m.88486 type:complete len:83 (+) Transcript_21696:1842-2090(+)